MNFWKLMKTDPLFRALVVAVTLSTGAVFVACTQGQRQVARTALDVVQFACIVANAEVEDEAIAKACDISKDLIPDMKKVLAEHRKAAAKKMAAARCSVPDAGPDAKP